MHEVSRGWGLGWGRTSRSLRPDRRLVPEKSLAQLGAHVRRPGPVLPQAGTPRARPWLRHRVAAAQTCPDACARHPPLGGHSPPRRGKIQGSPHLTPGNSNSPSRRAPAPSAAASASPCAAHHFLRGSVGRPGRAPQTPGAEDGPPPRPPAAAPGFPPLPGARACGSGCSGGASWGARPSALRVPLGRHPEEPRRRARPGPLLRPPAPRPAPGLPGLGTSGRERRGRGAKRAAPAAHTYPSMAQTGGGAHTVRGLTGSPRAEGAAAAAGRLRETGKRSRSGAPDARR